MGKLGNIIYSVYSSKEQVETYQKKIRDAEWDCIVDFIPENCTFLDLGCGAGYALHRAIEDKNAIVKGIDPAPSLHGVGRYNNHLFEKQEILQGLAEDLPFESSHFDVVYSSHVLEHVISETKALMEMKRVIKEKGVIILAMPTASMAIISWFSQLVFTTHIKIYKFIRYLFTNEVWNNFKNIFRTTSHSQPIATSIFYDLFHYREKKWQKTVQEHFIIEQKISPFLYPYPDFLQWFPMHRNKFFSSSVVFICRKKTGE